MKRWFIPILIALASTGWVLPFYLAAQSLYAWGRTELVPFVRNERIMGNSFPFFEFSQTMCFAASLWLAAVVFAWALVACRMLARARPEPPSPPPPPAGPP